MVTIRPEGSEDHDAARVVHERAFGVGVGARRASSTRSAPRGRMCPSSASSPSRARRSSPTWFFTRALLASGHEVLALAPMAVLPERQRAGVGSRLIKAALRRAAETGFPLVVVLGHPAYYPRFGFEPAAGYGVRAPWEVPPEAWMVHPLPAYDPHAHRAW